MKSIFLGILGGVVGSFVFHLIQTKSISYTEHKKSVQAQSFEVIDAGGRVKAQLSLNGEGQSGLLFYDNNKKVRLSLGLYQDQTGTIVINDKNENAVQIMRVFGPSEAPLHIFKTNATDMMILGLNPTTRPTPFLMYYDGSRNRNLPFGIYQGP